MHIQPGPWQTISASPRGTRRVARLLGQALPPGTVLGLQGALGAGKTSFVQGLAQGVGIANTSQVNSPTYTLVNVYEGGRLPLVHLDFYRLAEVESAIALGLQEMIGRSDAIVAVEWADRFTDLLPDATIWVAFELLPANFVKANSTTATLSKSSNYSKNSKHRCLRFSALPAALPSATQRLFKPCRAGAYI